MEKSKSVDQRIISAVAVVAVLRASHEAAVDFVVHNFDDAPEAEPQ